MADGDCEDIETILIVEDGTCVEGSNALFDIETARRYMRYRPGGQMWDEAAGGETYCDDDILRAIFAAHDFMNCLDWRGSICPCSELCIPCPCCCPKHRVSSPVKAMQLAAILLTDAILRGYDPYSGAQSQGIMIKSASVRGGGSYVFDKPVSLDQFKGSKKNAKPNFNDFTFRFFSILKCYLEQDSNARAVIL